MARVVQQRGGPPYLLIVFVILFVIATALATLFYIKYDEVQGLKVKVDQLNESLVNDRELKWPRVVKMRDNYQKAAPGQAQTVIGQFSAETDVLTESITGEPTDPQEALASVKAMYEEIGGPHRALVDQVRSLHKKQLADADEKKTLKEQLQTRDQQITQLGQDAQKAREDSIAEVAKLQGEMTALNEKIATDHKAHQEELKGAGDTQKDTIDKLNKRITEFVAQVQELQLENGRLKDENERLKRRPSEAGPGETAIRPDGKIMKILDESGLCYVNIGLKDRVRPQISFRVHSPTAELREGAGKGGIVVTKVMDNISVCRIVQQEAGNPIAVGDVISNVAFDKVRTYRFLVEGRFDLYGDGKPTEDGAKTVKHLIKRFGGTLTEQLAPAETDFVVLGAAPSKPGEPDEGAPASDWEIYREQKKVYDHYNNVDQAAQKLSIPVLNTNRFLDLTGYVPQRTLE